ncbi:MAG TPA: hypothetical protein D7I09_06645, partial [Candidatus Poseidoniales archaeon]
MESVLRPSGNGKGVAIGLLLTFLLPLAIGLVQPPQLPDTPTPFPAGDGASAPDQPWPQFMRSANKNGSMLDHLPGRG